MVPQVIEACEALNHDNEAKVRAKMLKVLLSTFQVHSHRKTYLRKIVKRLFAEGIIKMEFGRVVLA